MAQRQPGGYGNVSTVSWRSQTQSIADNESEASLSTSQVFPKRAGVMQRPPRAKQGQMERRTPGKA